MSTRINLTHAQSRERNAQFMDIVRKPETQEALKNLRKCKHVGYLKTLCEQQYNLRMPPEVDEQFGVRSAAVVALDSSDSG